MKQNSLKISGLRAAVAGEEILKGIDLEIKPGEVHAVMGPNGSGKSTLSHVLMGKPGYDNISGQVSLNGTELLDLETWQRAEAGLFLAMQYPVEVPGVSLQAVLAGAERLADDAGLADQLSQEAAAIGFDEELLTRPLNVGLSGGEKKRSETLQLAVLKPKYAVLDELDSGLDVDALSAVSKRVEHLTADADLGVLAITHYSRLFEGLKPDFVHVLADGVIVDSGGPELADELEASGYVKYQKTSQPTG